MDTDNTTELIDLHRETVGPDWIDYNGHMNVAFYLLTFDHATDTLLDHVGLGVDYRDREEASFFALEAHVTYEQEVLEGETVRVTTQILDFDPKRLHLFHRMFPVDGDTLVATNEVMIMHMDMTQRRPAPMPAAALERIEGIAAAHAGLPVPPEKGRSIGIRSKRPS